jgi:hypothetical protein
MAIGLRIRRPFSGSTVLDTTDYTVSVFYKTTMAIGGNGSLYIPGINASDFLPVFMPYNYPAPQKTYPDFSKDPIEPDPVHTPRAYISGSSIVWECPYSWATRYYTIMVVRIR